jgi:hypothetical protein
MRVVRVYAALVAVLLSAGAIAAQTPPKPAPRRPAARPAPPRRTTPAKPPAPALAPASAMTGEPSGSLLQVMRGILYPNSNIIFDVQNEVPAPKKGQLYSGWEGVENAAMALAESANLLLVPGRRCGNGVPVPRERADWAKFTQGLRTASLAAYQAAVSKNQETVSNATDQLTEACENCHIQYRDVKGGVAERCK